LNKQLIIATIFLFVFTKNLFGQDTTLNIFNDNNPKLTKQESAWLNKRFSTANFDFDNKYIRFVEVLSEFYGIGKFTLTIYKKNLLELDLNRFEYRILVLDSTQKNKTRGYDAFLILTLKINRGKLKRLNIEKLISESKNRYPQIPANAGLDTNSVMNSDNAIFLNELYKADFYPKTDYDFHEKKVAIFNTYCDFDKAEIVNIREYVKDKKTLLDKLGISLTDVTFYLDPEQKKESGGYVRWSNLAGHFL
jgi:hypothetical protein